MPKKSSFPKERIIPIQVEGREPVNQEKNEELVPESSASTSTCNEELIPDLMETENHKEDTTEPELVRDSSDDSTELSNDSVVEDIPPKRTLPMVNAKEKIILIVDSAEDENFSSFPLANAQKCKPLEMLKQAVEIFLHNKHMIDKKHEYALAVLTENNILWLEDFTNNINKILRALQQIESCETEDIFELNSLFDNITEKVTIPEVCEDEGTILPPPYVVRAILLYGRSYTMPKILESEEIQELLKSPYFTLDVLMTHEPVDEDNNCNKIFNVLQNLDQKGFAYFFSVERDAKRLFNSMGKLLGHPLQRPTQKFANYSIKV